MANKSFTGGYHTKAFPLIIEGGMYAHRRGLSASIPETVMNTIHKHNATPWQIDLWMYDFLVKAFKHNIKLTWADPTMVSMPNKVPEGVWELLTKEERNELKKQRSYIHTVNNKNVARRLSAAYVLNFASEIPRDAPLWFPYTMDFRGRIYSVGGIGPNPQGSEQASALLKRYFGEALTPEGRYWLEVGVGTEYGLDKEPFEKRAAWTKLNMNTLREISEDPIKTLEIWGGADKPLKFLGLVRELVQADAAPKYKVSRGVSLDGTCNGFQHLAAIMLDPETARLVNLTPGPRQDIYQLVADNMNKTLAVTNAAYRASRKSVKRAVMTTPYGVSSFGMSEQLMNDDVLDISVPVQEFRNILKETIIKIVGRPLEFMAWAQKVATVFGKQNHPLLWETPCGFVVQQFYNKFKSERVNFILVKGASFRMQHHLKDGLADIDVGKQARASAPNIIHSFDAAHLVKVCTHPSMPENPEGWLSTVHDSFNIHPNYLPTLQTVLRETFVEIYSEDWLTKLYETWAQTAMELYNCEIPMPPERGTLDISQITNSEFIFS